jgi:hypothetical protein
MLLTVPWLMFRVQRFSTLQAIMKEKLVVETIHYDLAQGGEFLRTCTDGKKEWKLSASGRQSTPKCTDELLHRAGNRALHGLFCNVP